MIKSDSNNYNSTSASTSLLSNSHTGTKAKEGEGGRLGWNVRSSFFAKNTRNRIRGIIEKLKISPNPEKPMIPLSIGDPTIFGNLKPSHETIEAIKRSIDSGKYNGYAHTQGYEEARKAIAKYSAHQSSDEIDVDDIIMCSGCSSALEYCILTLAEKGENVLVPRPGFCLYQTLAEGLGIEIRYYDLLPQDDWQVDLTQMEALIDENTAALLINNPSNPCGSVFSQKHLEEVIRICEINCLPIIADEIYEHFVFPGSKHIAVSSLSKNVPILSCGGLTKRFLVPGWRMGWIIIHDREKRLHDVSEGLKNMSRRILGSNTLVQGAIPDILEKTPQSYFDDVIDVLYKNAKVAFNILINICGLKPIMPNGAMYMMIGIDMENFPEYQSDIHFVEDLVNEQSVFCLPGSCFEYPNYIRIVLTIPQNMLAEACSRIGEFCSLHYKIDNRLIENGLTDDVKF